MYNNRRSRALETRVAGIRRPVDNSVGHSVASAAEALQLVAGREEILARQRAELAQFHVGPAAELVLVPRLPFAPRHGRDHARHQQLVAFLVPAGETSQPRNSASKPKRQTAQFRIPCPGARVGVDRQVVFVLVSHAVAKHRSDLGKQLGTPIGHLGGQRSGRNRSARIRPGDWPCSIRSRSEPTPTASGASRRIGLGGRSGHQPEQAPGHARGCSTDRRRCPPPAAAGHADHEACRSGPATGTIS
jgi:hypothetical protein